MAEPKGVEPRTLVIAVFLLLFIVFIGAAGFSVSAGLGLFALGISCGLVGLLISISE